MAEDLLDLVRAAWWHGYRAAEDELASAWQAAARQALGIPLAELERRRWGPAGREHFGDPRPGDYRGQR